MPVPPCARDTSCTQFEKDEAAPDSANQREQIRQSTESSVTSAIVAKRGLSTTSTPELSRAAKRRRLGRIVRLRTAHCSQPESYVRPALEMSTARVCKEEPSLSHGAGVA